MPGSDIEDAIDRAMQLGRDNQKLIGLIEAHCANARIVLEGGPGMVEAQTGLPIGMRSIRCVGGLRADSDRRNRRKPAQINIALTWATPGIFDDRLAQV